MSKAQCTSLGTSLDMTAGASQGPAMARGAGTFGGFVLGLVSLPIAALEVLMVWQERASQRSHLRQLDDRLLSDMGLSRSDVEHEASLPFWRAS